MPTAESYGIVVASVGILKLTVTVRMNGCGSPFSRRGM
jgi:hypothetical protein